MPQVVAGAAAWVTGAIIGATGTTSLVAAQAIYATAYGVVAVAASAAAMAASSLLAPNVGVAGSPTDWVADPDAPIHFAAARVGVAGRIIHRDEYGPNNMYQTFVTVVSGAGPIKSVVSFTGDDAPVSFSSEVATTSQWAGEMYLQTRLGAQPETAHTSPAGLKSGATLPGWTSSHKLSGQASYMLTLAENSKNSAFNQQVPKPILTIEGLYGYDPRQDSTYPGGSGACRLNDPATWVYLTNPILWALKWALGLWEGPVGKGAPHVDYQVGGMGCKVDGIDVAAFVEAANIADANGWTVAAYPSTDDTKSQVLDAFLQAGGAVYAQKAGRVSCIHRAAPRTSVVTISAADTAGPLEVDTTASRINRINTLRPRFWSEDHQWQMVSIDEVTKASWVSEDGGKRTRPLDFPYVPDADQAAQLAYLQTANTREGMIGTIPLKPHLQQIKPGDAFTITEPAFNMDGQKCLCLNTEFDAATGVHRVSFVSETDSKYDGLAETGTAPTPPAITPVDPTVVTPPDVSEWVVTSETLTGGDGSQVPTLVFTGAVDNDRAEAVIFEYRLDGGSNWQVAGTDNPSTLLKEVALASGDWEAAVSYRVGENTSERLVLDPVTLAGSVAGTFVDAGPLATSTLTEAEVQGRYFGAYAGDAAANLAGMINGDTYVDTSVYPPALKAKSGGVISEVGNTGARTETSANFTITNGAALAKVLTLNLTKLQARSFVTALFGLIVTPSVTKRSGAGPASPSGAWELRQKKTADLDSVHVVVRSGTWSSECNSDPPNCTAITIRDSAGADETVVEGTYYAKPSDRSVVGATAAMEWQLWLSNTAAASAGNLVDIAATMTVGIERNPNI